MTLSTTRTEGGDPSAVGPDSGPARSPEESYWYHKLKPEIVAEVRRAQVSSLEAKLHKSNRQKKYLAREKRRLEAELAELRECITLKARSLSEEVTSLLFMATE